MNLEIKIENVHRDTASCNFCSGNLSEHGFSLKYRYENVITFSRLNASGLKACICPECLQELFGRGMLLLNNIPNLEVSDTTESAQGTTAGNQTFSSEKLREICSEHARKQREICVKAATFSERCKPGTYTVEIDKASILNAPEPKLDLTDTER